MEITKNVAMPTGRHVTRYGSINDVVVTMVIGDSVLVESWSQYQSVIKAARRHSMKVTGRRQPEGNIRIWRIE
jgi:hypothetical protein